MRKSDKENKTVTLVDRIGKHPFIIFAGFVITVIALIVMIVLFFISQTERELVYAVNPVKTRVVTMGQATGLEVTHNRVELGDVDITVAQVGIWNSGDESIRKENILKEVVIYTKPSVRILEASVSNSSRELDILKFNIIESPELLEIGKVPVSWNILEKDDGASVQLIYLGPPEVEILVEGLIEGSGFVKKVGRDVKIKSPIEQVKSEEKGRWVLLPSTLFMLIAFIYMSRGFVKDWVQDRKSAIFELILSIIFLGMISASLWYIIGMGPFGPPFEF